MIKISGRAQRTLSSVRQQVSGGDPRVTEMSYGGALCRQEAVTVLPWNQDLCIKGMLGSPNG